MLPHAHLPPAFTGLVDDAAVFPPGDVPLPAALATYAERTRHWSAPLVGSFVIKDLEVSDVDVAGMPLSVVVTGGAGAVAGALRLGRKSVADIVGLEIALRDPDDLAGNARRIVAALDDARSEGLLDDGITVSVELPPVEPTASWLAAADEVAAAELRLKFRTGGLAATAFPTASTLAAWIDAALDRETPFKCTAGLHHAVRRTSPDGFQQHGFLNVLVATRQAFDGAGREQVAEVLERRDGVADLARGTDLAGARRWFTSFGSCSVDEPLADLVELGLVA